jgi:nitrosocyanin
MWAAAAGLLALSAGCGGGGTQSRTISAAMVGGEAGFTPSTITVNKGDRVELTVRNTTDRPHGFSIEGYGIREEVAPGQPLEKRFTAEKSGNYLIRCQLHDTHQTATLVVQ